MPSSPWRWMTDDEHPFAVPLLDLRELALHARSTPDRPEASERLQNTSRQPEPMESRKIHRLNLSYPLPPVRPQGAVFLAERPEEKWDVHFDGQALHFSRSWTGRTEHVVTLQARQDSWVAVHAQSTPDVTKPKAEIDFLIWTFVFARPVPHPVPEDLLTDDEAAVRWSVGRHGVNGWWASAGVDPERLRAQETEDGWLNL